MKKLLRKINSADIDRLKALKEVMTFEKDSELLKANEVPQNATLVLEGEIGVLKRDEEVFLLNPGYAVGVHEMLHNLPTSINVRAKKNAKAIMFSRGDLDERSPIFSILISLFPGLLL